MDPHLQKQSGAGRRTHMAGPARRKYQSDYEYNSRYRVLVPSCFCRECGQQHAGKRSLTMRLATVNNEVGPGFSRSQLGHNNGKTSIPYKSDCADPGMRATEEKRGLASNKRCRKEPQMVLVMFAVGRPKGLPRYSSWLFLFNFFKEKRVDTDTLMHSMELHSTSTYS